MAARPRGSYGVDAPGVPILWLGLAVASAAIAVGFLVGGAAWWSVALAGYFAVCALAYLFGAGLYWHASLRGKFAIWDRLLRDVRPGSPRSALDLGCGRGAVAIMTALRFPEAEVTGVDLWRRADQSGNSEAAARGNARANGVADRMRLITADMTALPLADASFELVTASLSIHNIPDREGRRTAIREAVRVLTPGGGLVLVDIRRGRDYAEELARLGLVVTGPRRLGWDGWWSGPWMGTSVVCAWKAMG
ncbi:MAG TPA: class I SAM-dependent methyltransferase [Gryllotalpicola sp.]